MNLDAAQTLAWQEFERLSAALQPKSKLRFWHKQSNPKGIYLWGSVGRGKTMLMDKFFASLPSSIKKSRQHFHHFMQEIHQARSKNQSGDVIVGLATDIAKKTNLLCLDEMQVVDIADAMILGRLFEALFAKGVILVTTANQPPEGQYRDGLNRDLFLPYIAKLNAALNVIHLDDGRDYRLGRMIDVKTYLTPLGPQASAGFNRLWAELTDNEQGQPLDLPLLGRKLHVPHASHACAKFTCAELVENSLGAADFLCLTKNFKTIFIADIPAFKIHERNQAKRFILLIDTLYDAKTKLVVTAQVPPDQLCVTGPHAREFQRTSSRLYEMQSQTWWQTLN